MELLGLEGVSALRSLNTPLFKKKVTAMFNRTCIALAAALVAATPLLALIEENTETALNTQDADVVQTSYAQILGAGPACGETIDVLAGYKAFLGKDTSYEDAEQLMMMIDGAVPNHMQLAPTPIVACY